MAYVRGCSNLLKRRAVRAPRKWLHIGIAR
jgi:hypothetical protein